MMDTGRDDAIARAAYAIDAQTDVQDSGHEKPETPGLKKKSVTEAKNKEKCGHVKPHAIPPAFFAASVFRHGAARNVPP